jgi:hypothetical protein
MEGSEEAVVSRQDPGAANGLPITALPLACVCGCTAAVHAPGRRGGQSVRTYCYNSRCDCRLYVAQRTAQPDRCPTCGAHLSAIAAVGGTT